MSTAQSIALSSPLRPWPALAFSAARLGAISGLVKGLRLSLALVAAGAVLVRVAPQMAPGLQWGWRDVFLTLVVISVGWHLLALLQRILNERYDSTARWDWVLMHGEGSLSYLNRPGDAVLHLDLVGERPCGEVEQALTALPGVRWHRRPEGFELRLETTRSSAVAFVQVRSEERGTSAKVVLGAAPARPGASPVSDGPVDVDAAQRPLRQLERLLLGAVTGDRAHRQAMLDAA